MSVMPGLEAELLGEDFLQGHPRVSLIIRGRPYPWRAEVSLMVEHEDARVPGKVSWRG
jgi:hypothetical protein